MKTSLLSIVLAGALVVSGCAELSKLSGKSSSVPIDELATAPIEERGVAGGTGPALGATGTAATAVSGGVGAGSGADGSGAAATGRGLEAQQVETHALPGMVATGQAMEGIKTPVLGKGGPTTDPSFKDPENPLSKRVIYFDFDSSAIREEFRPVVEAHAKYLKEDQSMRVILQGHTDERGSRDYNLALGQRRSESVRQTMSLLGVRDEQMEAVSLGEEKPAAEGDDEAAWSLNRRTEIHYLGE